MAAPWPRADRQPGQHPLPRCPTASTPTSSVTSVQYRPPRSTVRTKSGERWSISPEDVVAVRELSHAPVRASRDPRLEHAAALALAGHRAHWHDGWLLRAGGGTPVGRIRLCRWTSHRQSRPVPAIVGLVSAAATWSRGWHCRTGCSPVRAAGIKQHPGHGPRLSIADATPTQRIRRTAAGSSRRAWLGCYQRDVADRRGADRRRRWRGGVRLASRGVAVGRGALTSAPDGTHLARHLSGARLRGASRAGSRRAVCEALQTWGIRARCATRLRAGARRQPRPHHAVRLARLRTPPSPAATSTRASRRPTSLVAMTTEGLRVATWNVNSIRTRVDRVVDWLIRAEVDVLAMQETKCTDDQFPTMTFLPRRAMRWCTAGMTSGTAWRSPRGSGSRRCGGRVSTVSPPGAGRQAEPDGRGARTGRHLRRCSGVESVCAERPGGRGSALPLQAGMACRTA